MIDHLGQDIVVGWSDHHIVWLEAALTLPSRDRAAAYHDIADMTGRTFASVRMKACWLGEKRRNEQLRIEAARTRRILIVDRGRGANKPKLAPSELAPISKARLMGCR